MLLHFFMKWACIASSLSKVEEPFVSGIAGVAWDVVEFPSQFLEYFSYDKDVLKLLQNIIKQEKY